jgi:hypothetical protein
MSDLRAAAQQAYDRGCYKCKSHYCPGNCLEPLHLRREWLGLTDKEIHDIMLQRPLVMDFARAVEAALKERNV